MYESELRKAALLEAIENGELPWDVVSTRSVEEYDMSPVGGGRVIRVFNMYVGPMDNVITPEAMKGMIDELPEAAEGFSWMLMMFGAGLQGRKEFLFVEVGPNGELPERLRTIIETPPAS